MPARGPGVGVRAAYDAIARSYDRELADELDRKPLDRAMLTAFVDTVGAGPIVDIGCGPGHVTRFLARRHRAVFGMDLSRRMIAVAAEHGPGRFAVGSMLGLPAGNAVCAGVVALYSIIHLSAAERALACREFARVLQPGGWLLVAFHVESADIPIGGTSHLSEWFGEPVDLDGYFLDPEDVVADLAPAGFAVQARLDRRPIPGAEYPSRRCYLLAQRGADTD